MTLRRMTLLVVGLTFLAMIAAVSITLDVTLIRHFEEVEKQSVYQNLERAQAAFQNAYALVEQAAEEWASSSNIFASVEDLRRFGISIQVVARLDGSMVSTRMLEQQPGLAAGLPQALADRLKSRSFLAALQGRQAVRGVLAVPGGPLLIVARPVAGETGQFVLAGMILNENEVQRLASAAKLPMALVEYNGPELPEDFKAARANLASPGEYYAFPQSEDSISGYLRIDDLDGVPAYLLRIDQPRPIYRNGRIVMNYLIAALVASGIVFAVIMLLMLERLVISRLGSLNREVARVGESGDPALRVSERGHDELSSLSRHINGMLGSLEAAQELERSRVSELDALYEVSRALLAPSGTADVLISACRLAIERFGADAAWIGMVGKDETEITASAAAGIAPEVIAPVRVGWREDMSTVHPCERVVRTGEVSIQPVAPGVPWQAFERDYACVAVLPVTREVGQGALLSLYSRGPGAFPAGRVQLLQSFANLTGKALENASLFEQVLAGRQRLQVLSRRLVEVQEEERRAIAQELHDEVGQILTGLKLLLDAGGSAPPEALAGKLREAQGVVNELIGKVRQMSLDLRPAMLDDLGLLPALLWLFQRYTSQTQVQVRCQHQGVEHQRFTPQIETAAYRVVQEGLTNVARYAGVSEAAVRLWNSDGVLGIQIEDRGAGFDADKALSNGNSRGLLGMRERATTLGGRLSIESIPGQGTCLTVELPLSGYLERRKNAR